MQRADAMRILEERIRRAIRYGQDVYDKHADDACGGGTFHSHDADDAWRKQTARDEEHCQDVRLDVWMLHFALYDLAHGLGIPQDRERCEDPICEPQDARESFGMLARALR